MSDPSPRMISRATWIAACVAILSWAWTLANGYAVDDLTIARATYDSGEANPYVAELLPLTEYFTSHYWAVTVENDTLFRPVTILSFALRQAICGESAFVDHAINVLLHGVASALVLRLCLLIGASVLAATVGAIAFATLAIHAEAVAYVVGRAELLAFVFGAAATLLVGARAGWLRCVSAAVCLFLALCSKESAAAWVPFWLVIGVVRSHVLKLPWRLSAGLCAIVPAVVIWVYLRQNMIAGLESAPVAAPYAANPLVAASFGDRLAGGVEGMGLGVLLSMVPLWLSSDWGAQLFDPFALPRLQTWAAALVLAAWIGFAFRGYRRHPLMFVSMAAFLGFAFPLSNILFPIGVSFAERLYYLPSLGVALWIAWLVQVRPQRSVLVFVAVWYAFNFAVAQWRGPMWKNNETLHLADVERQPRSVSLHMFAANALLARRADGDPQRALEHVRSALALDPESAVALSAIAGIQSSAGALKEATGSLRIALQSERLAGHHIEDQLWLSLGNVYSMREEWEDATRSYARALGANRYRAEAFERLLALRDGGKSAPDALPRLIASIASDERVSARRNIWDAYGILARVDSSWTADERALLRTVLESLPRGIYANPLRRLLSARVR